MLGTASTIALHWQVIIALLIDWLVGDPPWLTHPVVWMGRGITWLEPRLRRGASSQVASRIRGAALTLILVSGSWLITWYLIRLGALVHPWLGTALSIWLLSTTLAANGLARAAWDVARPLSTGDLDHARTALSMIVGRDTATLPQEEIIRGVVETVAENTVDGVLSPLIYAFLGGAPLAMAYKAVNTLDSMVGHLDERYRYFGWASARLDDFANLIPARCSALLLALAAGIRGSDGRRALITAWRDARQHPSPNGGWPEASVAGALGVRLGGINFYDGEPEIRAYMGDPLRSLSLGDIERTIGMMATATSLAALIGLALSFAL